MHCKYYYKPVGGGIHHWQLGKCLNREYKLLSFKHSYSCAHTSIKWMNVLTVCCMFVEMGSSTH